MRASRRYQAAMVKDALSRRDAARGARSGAGLSGRHRRPVDRGRRDVALAPAAAAVDENLIRGHEFAGVRAHEKNQFGNLLGLREAIHWHILEETLHQLL